ncbi:MAG: EMC3/TMCO1 family protein [Candidatus Woesearchaeota archaeon]|nr:EMC3/TMCO1 family protein [Candidatus Woesearchaeota archaeon]
MAFYEYLNKVIDPLIGPLLMLGHFWALVILSLVLSVITTLIYKFMTNQQMLKAMNEELKNIQKEMKKHSKNAAKVMELQKKSLDLSMKRMVHTLWPTFVNFIPLILVFGWLSMNFTFAPIEPNQKFDLYVFFENNITGNSNITINVPGGLELLSDNKPPLNIIKAGEEMNFKNIYITNKRYNGFLTGKEDIYFKGWKLKGKEGTHTIEIDVGNAKYFIDVMISKNKYINPIQPIEDGVIKGIMIDLPKLNILNLFGWKIGWLGSYIIFSLLFATIVRKVLKVY